MNLCPCGSNKAYLECCGAFIEGHSVPNTPEELMRSRYTAYSQANIDYIARTMKGPAAIGFDPEDAKTWAEQVEWLRLDVLKTESKPPLGWVEFIAHFSNQGIKQNIHELSEFHLEDGQWFYTKRKNLSAHVGRNDPCPCGSNKKYKKCCGS